jgi:hypothetical protein
MRWLGLQEEPVSSAIGSLAGRRWHYSGMTSLVFRRWFGRRTCTGAGPLSREEFRVSAEISIKTVTQSYEAEVEQFTPVSFAANDFFAFRGGEVACYRGTEDTAQTGAVLRG